MTPQEIKLYMQDAKEILRHICRTFVDQSIEEHGLKEAIREHNTAWALCTALNALEMQIPTKPARSEDGTFICPTCGEDAVFALCSCEYQLNYCDNCGQRIDWEGEL